MPIYNRISDGSHFNLNTIYDIPNQPIEKKIEPETQIEELESDVILLNEPKRVNNDTFIKRQILIGIFLVILFTSLFMYVESFKNLIKSYFGVMTWKNYMILGSSLMIICIFIMWSFDIYFPQLN